MAKNIMICCDGTGNEFGPNNTNVVKVFELAQNDKPQEQICYYDPGVGTKIVKYSDTLAWLKSIFSGASGAGLQKNVNDAYKYLMRVYEEGDKVFIFGFSRGAFTARSLAGMLYKCGLLRPRLDNMVEYAAKMYNTRDNNEVAAKFKKTFSRKCPVHFVGVWDTVKSLAMNAGRKFHDSKLNPEVSCGCHAISLDEVRRKFPPDLWDDRENVEQVWFAGVHSDVGGWYKECGLSDISLDWMVSKAKQHGLLFDDPADGIAGDPFEKAHTSFQGFWRAFGKHVRKIPQGGKIHSSVKTRLAKGDYKPKAKSASGKKLRLDSDDVDFVD